MKTTLLKAIKNINEWKYNVLRKTVFKTFYSMHHKECEALPKFKLPPQSVNPGRTRNIAQTKCGNQIN